MLTFRLRLEMARAAKTKRPANEPLSGLFGDPPTGQFYMGVATIDCLPLIDTQLRFCN